MGTLFHPPKTLAMSGVGLNGGGTVADGVAFFPDFGIDLFLYRSMIRKVL